MLGKLCIRVYWLTPHEAQPDLSTVDHRIFLLLLNEYPSSKCTSSNEKQMFAPMHRTPPTPPTRICPTEAQYF
jgi:hypothetical protein